MQLLESTQPKSSPHQAGIQLLFQTPSEWGRKIVQEDFNTFLVEHAGCERKAGATAMSFVVQYPDRIELVDQMIGLAREELHHFHQVFRLCKKRGLKLVPDSKDPYMTLFIKNIRTGREERLLDRLLVFGITEARGCERFGLVADALEAGSELKTFYDKLTESEARHHEQFLNLARLYFKSEVIEPRLQFLLEIEAEIIQTLPFRANVH